MNPFPSTLKGLSVIGITLALSLPAPVMASQWPAHWPDREDHVWQSMETAHETWSEKFWDHMLQADDPALRVVAIGRSGPVSRARGEPFDVSRAIRDLAAAASDPAAGAAEIWGAVGACDMVAKTGAERDDCYTAINLDRLKVLEPGNAAVDLVRINATAIWNQPGEVDTATNRKRLARAARGDHFNLHYSGASLAVTEAAIRFERSNPVESTWDIPGTEHFYLENVIYTGSFMMGLNLLGVRELCNAYAANEDEKGVADCLAVARLMESSGKTTLTRRTGTSIRLAMNGINEDSPEWAYERQKGHALYWKWHCQSPAWVTDPFRLRKEYEPATPERALAFARAQSNYGEIEANRRLAFTDYAENPQDYAFDPALCDQFAELDDATIEHLTTDGPIHSITEGLQKLVELGAFNLEPGGKVTLLP